MKALLPSFLATLVLAFALPFASGAQTTTLPDETPAPTPRFTPVPRPTPPPPDVPVGTVNGQPIYRPLFPSELANPIDRALVVYDYNHIEGRLSEGELANAMQEYQRAKFAGSDARLDAKLRSLNATRADFRQFMAEEVKIHVMLSMESRGSVSIHGAQRAQADYLARLRQAATINRPKI